MELTDTQLNLYIAIKEYIEEYGYSPSIRDLCKLTGKSSPGTIQVCLKKLKDKGYVDYIYNHNRTIRIVKEVEYEEEEYELL